MITCGEIQRAGRLGWPNSTEPIGLRIMRYLAAILVGIAAFFINIGPMRAAGDPALLTKPSDARSGSLLVKTDDRDKFAEALDKEWPGPVPYTLLIAPGGKVLYRKAGAIDPLEVKRAVVSYLGRTY